MGVKIVVRVKLLPASEEAVALRSTLLACNRAADQVSRVAFDKREFSKFGLQKVVYADLKACGLGAQAAIRTIKKVCDAYTTLQANIRAGNLSAGFEAPGEGGIEAGHFQAGGCAAVRRQTPHLAARRRDGVHLDSVRPAEGRAVRRECGPLEGPARVPQGRV